MPDFNSESSVVNAYTLKPYELESGMQMLYTIKAMISEYAFEKGEEPTPTFVLYKCAHHVTPNQSVPTNDFGVPQGQRIYADDAKVIRRLGYALFPVLRNAGAQPDPFHYGIIEDE